MPPRDRHSPNPLYLPRWTQETGLGSRYHRWRRRMRVVTSSGFVEPCRSRSCSCPFCLLRCPGRRCRRNNPIHRRGMPPVRPMRCRSTTRPVCQRIGAMSVPIHSQPSHARFVTCRISPTRCSCEIIVPTIGYLTPLCSIDWRVSASLQDDRRLVVPCSNTEPSPARARFRRCCAVLGAAQRLC